MAMGLLALATLAVFARGLTPMDTRVLLLFMACMATSGMAYAGWKKSPQGSLRWDGQHWYWSGFATSPVCHLSVLMDFQNVVLVSIESDGLAAVYLWLEATPGDTSWRPLRRAMVSSKAVSDERSRKPGLSVEGDLA